jgi:hypothetical protein
MARTDTDRGKAGQQEDRLADPPYVGDNPKKASRAEAEAEGSNLIKDPDDWVSGGEPMTGAQKSYLKTLSEEAHDPDAYDEGLDKAEASKRIDALKERLGL